MILNIKYVKNVMNKKMYFKKIKHLRIKKYKVIKLLNKKFKSKNLILKLQMIYNILIFKILNSQELGKV